MKSAMKMWRRSRKQKKNSVGLTNEEIGNLLKLTVSGVKQRITRCKAVLKEKLKEEGWDGIE